jgi:heterogeneous nuclear ribonucleoprotein R
LNFRQNVGGSELEISLAKPPSDKKKKEDMLRKREQRMMRAMTHR